MKVNPSIAISETGFLFHAATGDSFSVNPTGLRILELIREGKAEKGIADQLHKEYTAEHDRIEEDLADYLHFLRQQKIVIDG